MARPRVRMPTGYRDVFLDLASKGPLQERVAAECLNMSVGEFRAVLKHNATAREAWNDALAVECDRMLAALYERAMAGDVRASEFLLRSRHGMSTESKDKSPGVNITFQLPAAMTPDQYRRVIDQTREALPSGSDSAA